jgi:pimeloyl-ACP methyl ester carboxylesterase
VAACRFDFSAWISFGCQLGASRVVLAGHSLGAYKAVAYLGTSNDQRVAGLISASGPLRMWERLIQDPERLARAEDLVKEGRGQELLPPDQGGRITSAQTLVWRARFGMDPYGFQHESDSEAVLARVQCPVLFVLGSEEPEIGRKADLPRLKQNARSATSVDSAFVQGANHVYQGHEVQVADAIGDWLERLPH